MRGWQRRWWMPWVWVLALGTPAHAQPGSSTQPGEQPGGQQSDAQPSASGPPAAVETRGLDERVPLGRPARPVRVRIIETETGPELQLAGRSAPLPFAAVPVAALRQVPLGGGAQVAVLLMRDGDRRAGAILSHPRGGRPQLLWLGLLSDHGDPGERQGHLLEIIGGSGDGPAEVRLSRTLEGIARCGERRSPLSAQVVDPATLQLRSAILPLAAAAEDATVAATEAPAGAGQRGPHLLTPISVSSAAAGTDAAGLRLAARALVDGDPTTAWEPTEPGGGRGAFATLRWESARWPLRALSLTLPPPGAKRADPRRITLTTEAGHTLDVEVPAAAPAAAGPRTVWVVPGKALSARCLTVTIAESEGPGDAAVGIGELRGYSELDFQAPLPALVAQLADGGGDAAEAERLLIGLGSPAVAALRAQWPQLTTSARRRALRVAFGNARADAAGALFVDAAMDDDAALRGEALDALVRLGADGLAQRRAVLGHRVAGAELARRLGREADPAGVDELLAAFESPGEAPVGALREALSDALTRHGDPGLQRLSAWAGTRRDPGVESQVALAAASVAGASGPATLLVARNLRPDNAANFELAWRLVAAAAALQGGAGETRGVEDTAVDAELARVAAEDERWMLRDAALRALGRRGAPGFEAVARARLLDPYPRVRASAVRGLGALGAGPELIAKHAEQDRWFLVRVAALEAMSDDERAREVIRGRVRDRVPAVRAAAVVALQRVGDRGAWPAAVEARVAAKDEYPQVISAGITYARGLCIKAAGPTLRKVVERGLQPDAWEPDRELALEALRALQHLEGSAAVAPLAQRAGPEVAAMVGVPDERAGTPCQAPE